MDNRQMAVEILRYPILILSICLALLILKRCAGYEISKLGPHGAEFSQQAQVTERAVSEIEARLNGIEVRVAELHAQLNAESSSRVFKLQEEIEKVEVAAVAGAQTVPDSLRHLTVVRGPGDSSPGPHSRPGSALPRALKKTSGRRQPPRASGVEPGAKQNEAPVIGRIPLAACPATPGIEAPHTDAGLLSF